MVRCWKLLMAMAGLVVLVGCGGGGGGQSSSPPAPQTPTLTLRAQPDESNFDKLTLTWRYSASVVADGFQLEYQVDGSAYQPLLSELIPQIADTLYLTFDSTTPECHTFGFRLSAMRGMTALAQSEVVYRRSLRPVWNPALEVWPERDAVLATWRKDPSSIATGFVVERNDGLSGWLAVPGGVDGGDKIEIGCWDFSREEGRAYTYRIIPTLGTERGMATKVNVSMPTKGPDRLSASASGAGIRVGWTNRSTTATEVKVYRAFQGALESAWSEPVLVATLPATATSFQDAAPPQGIRLAYQVVATLPNWPSTPSAWCLAGGPTTVDGLGMSRSSPVLSWNPMARDADGAWLGLASLWGGPRYAKRIERFPNAAGYPMDVPLSFGNQDYPTHTASSQLWPDGTFDLQVTEQVGSFGALNIQVMRQSGGTWARRAFHADQGLLLGGGGFSRDGVFQAFTYLEGIKQGQFRFEPDGTVVQGLVPNLPIGGKWGPFPTPSGAWVALAQDQTGWYLASRGLDGLWTFRLLPAIDPATYKAMDCLAVQADANGELHVLFANKISGGFRVDYVRVSPSVPEEVQTVFQGVAPGFGWGRGGVLAVTPDGSRQGFAIMDDVGELRIGVRVGSGSWALRTGFVPDARINWTVPFLACGFSPQGRFWVLHDEVAHPTGASQERYFELLEDLQP